MENAPEGTSLNFEGGLNVIEDLDKVSCNETYLEYKFFKRLARYFIYIILMKTRKNTFITIVQLDHISIVNLRLNTKFTLQRRQIIAISRYNRRRKSRSK